MCMCVCVGGGGGGGEGWKNDFAPNTPYEVMLNSSKLSL